MLRIQLVSTVVLVGSFMLGCKPEVGQAPSLITDYGLLAVKGDPAEVAPGAAVTYSFLLASPTGTVTDATAAWDVCDTPKPPAENNAVASACNPPTAGPTIGQTLEVPMPAKACMLFGPIAPPVESGKSGGIRPRDPDVTGGYYLPVRVKLPELPSGIVTGFAFERIICALANADTKVKAEFEQQYKPNNHPGIAETDLIKADGNRLSLESDTQTVALGETVTFESIFAEGSAETFPVLNQTGDRLEPQSESLHMSWFATSGAFQHDRTGVAANETAISTSNTWTAPVEAIPVHLWLVLRDSRGGTAFKSYELQVSP
jgi:hypothetical protein